MDRASGEDRKHGPFNEIAMDILTHYRQLVHKVDTFSAAVVQRYGDYIVCRHGCINCCRHDITVFPLEYHILYNHYSELPAQRKSLIRNTFDHTTLTESCALLHQGGCLLYSSRPIICRTHGLPLVIHEHGAAIRDCCPQNFSHISLEDIPDKDLLQLETLNTILISLNNAFCAQERIDPAKRMPISSLIAARSCT